MEIVFLFEHPPGPQLHTNTVILSTVLKMLVLSSWISCYKQHIIWHDAVLNFMWYYTV